MQHLKTDETTTFKLLWSPPLKAHNNNKAERLRVWATDHLVLDVELILDDDDGPHLVRTYDE